ncbi:MAG: DNA polymerase III subunit beta [Candidatus Dojkabacteria bacterium]|nr:DNA polymerase III subunit beta [Candidatus Dojkabacteria bacterium]
MKFSCNQDTFSKYLNIVSRVVSSKPGLPILNNVKFETSKGKLLITATDLELGISTWIGADIQSEGKITVPAKQLSEFINSIPNEKIDVELDGQKFKISTVNNSAEFNTIPVDDYPEIVTIDKETPLLKINSEDLTKSINRVAFAAATDNIKPVLAGILMEIDNSKVNFVGTDGLRLSRQTIDLDSGSEESKSLLIPVKAMQELSFIISELTEDGSVVELYLIKDRNQVLFRVGDIDLTSRLIDGDFPEYRPIIPTGFNTQCSVKRSEFLDSLKVTNIIARSVLGNKVILDINSKDNAVTMSASQSDVGSNQSTFNGEIDGENLKIAFSSRLLTDVLNHLQSEDIVFECSEAVKPGVFKVKDDENFIHLVMPMML